MTYGRGMDKNVETLAARFHTLWQQEYKVLNSLDGQGIPRWKQTNDWQPPFESIVRHNLVTGVLEVQTV